ncbi:MAG: glycosyltransferase [Methylococcaceae bacterium]|nr:glycosyltransferase [Methylococcaceae bacterium]
MKNKYEFKLNTAEVNNSHMGLARRIHAGEKVLELGCSSGYLSRFLKQDLGCTVVGVDIDHDALREAAAFCDKAIVADLDNNTWLEKIARDKFDTILCADVLEHLKNPAALLASLKPYLNPKGRILASIPNVAHASIRLELLQGHFDYESLGILDDTHLHFYTLDGCAAMFMEAGYLCTDVAYSIHDVADEVINSCLEKVGMTLSAQGRQRLHAPDATAFQYIIEAFPAAEAFLTHKPPILSPKPLVSSGAFYSLLVKDRDDLLEHNKNHEISIKAFEQKVMALEQARDAEKIHNQNHTQNIHAFEQKVAALEQERDAEKIHNQNHLNNIQAFEIKVAALEQQAEHFNQAWNAEKIHNQNHLKNIHAFEETVAVLEQQLINLEQLLAAEKIHNQNHVQNIHAFEETVALLEQTLTAEKIHNQNHLKNIQALQETVATLEQSCEAEKFHNQNHVRNIAEWVKTVRYLDERLFDFTLHIEALNGEQQSINAAVAHAHAETHRWQAHAEHLHADVNRLEEVLQRVHKKASYRAIRFIKNSPQAITNTFKKPNRHERPLTTEHFATPDTSYNVHDYTAWLARYGDMSQALQVFQGQIKTWAITPTIAILMPTYNTTSVCLEAAIESVLAQVYPFWELCIADDASTEPHVRAIIQRYAAVDSRIKTVFRTQNGHISIASNSALELVSADYVALMDHDDVITPDALYWVARTIYDHPEVQLIYSDEDKLNVQGERYGPYFKSDWNPELFMSHNFICHLGVYKTAKIRSLGGFDPAFDGAQDYNLALRYVATITDHEIQHIPRILYHWRAMPGSTANGIHEKPYAEPLIRKAVEQALLAKGVAAEVTAHAILPGALRVRYALPKCLPLVSIVIPTRNGFSLLKRCVESILAKTDYTKFEMIIIDNGSDDFIAQRYLTYLEADQRITVLRDDSPFNYAALNNKAVAVAKGEIIALLNNDLEVVNNDWLSEMVSYAIQPGVGAVGAKLYYPNNLIQHAGVIVGLGGVAGHSHKHFPRDNAGYCGRLFLTQNLSAVTAACLVVKKAVFDQVGGFDAVNLSVAFNDVDLCLRIQEAGFWNVWTPYAELYHYESATRGYEDTPEKQARFTLEIAYMKQRWGDTLLEDPAYNPNLTLDREDFSFAFPPRV